MIAEWSVEDGGVVGSAAGLGPHGQGHARSRAARTHSACVRSRYTSDPYLDIETIVVGRCMQSEMKTHFIYKSSCGCGLVVRGMLSATSRGSGCAV